MEDTRKVDPSQGIWVKNAREHNLKGVDLLIPRNKMTVITGLSGSGKSSFAFDTVYAEGQRRYVESLSAYARSFLDQMKKPEVDVISGLSPAIAIDQKSVGTNPRSTVGTVTEIYDFLRLLYARLGTPHCPDHHIPVASQTPQQILSDILELKEGTKIYILAPMASHKKGEFHREFQRWFKKGFLKAKVDGEFIELEGAKKLAKTKAHNIDLVVDQLPIKEKYQTRLGESINTALQMSGGQIIVETAKGERKNYSIHSACPTCGFSFPQLEPRIFSFNNPRGACETCNGLGTIDLVEEEYDSYSSEGRSIKEVRIRYKGKKTNEEEDEDLDAIGFKVCPECEGTRLSTIPRNVLLAEKYITEVSALPATEIFEWIEGLNWTDREMIIAEKISKQIKDRVGYLVEVGAGYLSLDRPARTLSGGEAQRIRLASQLGSSLVGILYVMDEPSIGLHPRDHHRLLNIINRLKDRGNTVLVVEHDEDTIRAADYVIDFGPRAGRLGGEVLAEGTPEEVLSSEKSITGQYLSGKKRIEQNLNPRSSEKAIVLNGARGNNLKNVNLTLPLNNFVAVTGVSGSGKSTLIIDTLYRKLSNHFYRSKFQAEEFDSIEGLEYLDKVIQINQRPIGRTPRSTPATYVGLFPLIRDLFSQLPESRIRGYEPGRFSFNVKGGRCEACQGQGQIKVVMHFLSDVYVKCDTCQGKRYNRETLQVHYKDKSIADILEMSVEEAREFFENHRTIHRKLDTLHRVGLDYMTLGQSSTTLSGGEAQRVKLSKELSKRGSGKTLYILDEPTTGLHFEDIRKLVELLHELVGQGNTVLVIEHNLDVIKTADHIIDLGPEGGKGGGEIVFTGSPEEILKEKSSYTGQFLKKLLAQYDV